MGNSNENTNKPMNLKGKIKVKSEEVKEIKEKLDKAKNQKDIIKLEKGRNSKIKYELNIYIYSNYNIDNYIANYFSKCNNDAFDWEFKPIEVGFSKTKSNKLIQYFKKIM